MFDIGWPELLMVAVVLILVVGPKDLPPMLRSFGRTVKKYRGMANDFKGQFNDALEESELDELRQTVAEAKSYNPLNQVSDAVKGVGADISEAVDDVKPWTPKPEEISDVARSVGAKEVKARTASAKAKATADKIAVKKTAVPKKTATPRKSAAVVKKATAAAKKPTATAKKPVAKKPTAKAPAAELSAVVKTPVRKPRTAAAKKLSTGTGKAKVK